MSAEQPSIHEQAFWDANQGVLPDSKEGGGNNAAIR